MIFKPEDPKDNQDHDYFDGPELPDPVKKPKEPKLEPEDPLYWEKESEWEHLKMRRRRRRRFYWWLVLAAVIIGCGVACWLRYFSPYIREATQYGYVEMLEERGTVFHTFEGVLLPYKELHDTTRTYHQDIVFSVADGHVAAELKRLQKAGLPAVVDYEVYHATVPWRGSSRLVIVAADTADTRKILPMR